MESVSVSVSVKVARSGIVDRFTVPPSTFAMSAESGDGDGEDDKSQSALTATMCAGLDSVGWEKVLVSFDNPLWLPLSHNKICAMTKFGSAVDWFLGFQEGRSVMQDAAAWLASGSVGDEGGDGVGGEGELGGEDVSAWIASDIVGEGKGNGEVVEERVEELERL
jgi:hypothetical protein